MEAQASRYTSPVLIAAAIAVIVFCAAGVAAIMGWIPTSIGGVGGQQATPQALQSPAPAPVAAPVATPPATPVQVVDPRPAAPRPTAPVVTARARCGECGVIESVHEVQKAGAGTGLGAVGGAVAGGVVGHQVGGGRGQDVMTVVGAVAGGLAGNQIEKKVRTTRSYEITVRMHDGSTRVVSESAQPSWRAGDRVKLIDGRIRPDTA